MKSNYLPPTYFENFVVYDNEKYFKEIKDIEWRGQIKSSANNRKFKIKYYGDMLEDYNYIVWTDFAPSLIFAVDVETGEEILLFDGAKHGYNSMLCDTFTDEQITNRPLTKMFADNFGSDTFEVIVSIYFNIDYDEELEEFLNENGEVELVSGEIVSADLLVRNGLISSKSD
ncbi:hypothetical protein [Flavobacterium limi]|uniref:Uncharacterized protein n=1 Tax=Flavobacterium limi TaxID=2045105 RepID=A0ABQ1UDH9_9FLAO|nr:hypothetical protein [Flavobacterium limi]GGF16251.1 hypothetical protein GCM10011518_27050 [Flavobacterium limi]